MEDVSRVLGVSSWSLYQWAKRYGNDQGMGKGIEDRETEVRKRN